MAQYADTDRTPIGAVRMVDGVKLSYIDSGFWRISIIAAKEICGGTLPRHGYEKLVKFGKGECRVMRTMADGHEVWSIRGEIFHESRWKS